MPYQDQTFGESREKISFPILPSENSDQENQFYVGDGVCYSTYSLETGSFIKINGLNTDFSWESNAKVFLEIDVGINLSIRGNSAQLKIETVGEEAPDGGWGTYPAFYSIEPRDIIGEDGKIERRIDSKRQRKCYVLIGYLENDSNKNGDSDNKQSNSNDNENEKVPVQILTENVILIQTVVSGVPCLAPFPYFKGGLTHLESIIGEE
jgi:hypothetical protein